MAGAPKATAGLTAASDEQLLSLALSGDAAGLDRLLRRHQAFLYNVALRVLQNPDDAAEATQESLLKIVTHLSSFRGDSAFRSWAYRIAFNQLLDFKRSRPEAAVHGFDCYADYLDRAPDEELAESYGSAPERELLLAEARLSCLMGMLLCLDRKQRLVFVLGEIFEISDGVGGELLGTSRDNFRQMLSRVRKELSAFMQDRCGLVSAQNPCRCARKTQAFVRDGIVDPQRLVFASAHYRRVRELALTGGGAFDRFVEDGNSRLYRDHPCAEAPADLVARVRELLAGEPWRSMLHLN